MALKGLLNPVLQEKVKLTYEQQNNISEYWILIIPFLRLFFQNIMDDDKSKDFLRELARCDKKTFREVINLLVVWFFYNLDRTVLRGVNDLFDDQKVRNYLIRVWFVDAVELSDITNSLDNAPLEKRQQIFCEFLSDKLGNNNINGILNLFVSAHMFGNLKVVLSLSEDQLIKLSM